MQIKAPDNAVPASSLPAQRPADKAPRGPNSPAEVKKVAREFEAMFVSMMLKSMRETVPKNPLTSGGRGEEVFSSLLDQEYATAAVQGGGIGLAQTLERELTRAYGVPVAAKGVHDAD